MSGYGDYFGAGDFGAGAWLREPIRVLGRSRRFAIGSGAGLLARALMVVAMVLALAPNRAAAEMINHTGALLQGLDKITARVSTITVAVGETVHFGTLLITVRACREAPPIEPPEAAVFLEIKEVKPDEAPISRFSGWMFASSPALSALEHPVYDIWVKGCQDRK